MPPTPPATGPAGITPSNHHEPMNTYRILTIRDPRTPGFRWYEIEGRNADTGETWTAAVCDTKDEARDTLRAIEGATR